VVGLSQPSLSSWGTTTASAGGRVEEPGSDRSAPPRSCEDAGTEEGVPAKVLLSVRAIVTGVGEAVDEVNQYGSDVPQAAGGAKRRAGSRPESRATGRVSRPLRRTRGHRRCRPCRRG
jgi:hypothetical protein